MVNDNETYESKMRPPKYPKLWNREWLTDQYVEQRRTIRDIATEIGCYWYSVKNALVKLGIQRRKYTMTNEALIARVHGGQSKKNKRRIPNDDEKNEEVAEVGDGSIQQEPIDPT